ncbi:MAG: putative bifunctional diguanylate cyclase/phosphodiesterase [Acidimicrobiales bacterium]
MDHWQRRLHLMARAGAPVGSPDQDASDAETAADAPSGSPVVPAPPSSGRGGRLDGVDASVASRIHPDETAVVATLLDIAARRSDFRAELSLLTRAGDRWENQRYEVVHEVMGPVLRPVAVVPGAVSVTPTAVGTDAPMRVDGGRVVFDRAAVLRAVGQALERRTSGLVAVLLLDLDRFKQHNDLIGDEAGDELLRQVAERVTAAAGRSFSGSTGGDEFVIVLEGIDDVDRARSVGERVRRSVAEPFEVGNEQFLITATVGVAAGDGSATAASLLRDADTAVFAGKDRGRDRVQVFGKQLEARTARQLGSAQRLRRALREGTLQLHYQPVVSLDSGMVVAAEALMRMSEGRDGDEPISPSHLIDAAEDTGLIARLGRYLLEETTTQIARWEERLGEARNFRVSLNVSPIQLSNRDFSAAIGHALTAAGVAPRRLSLELTESVLLGSDAAVDTVVQELVDMGIAFGLDDFGAEGSSLGGLRRFPLEFVKIDRQLVANLDTDERVEAIIASTVSLARQLGFTTVAVGVERERQRDLLRQIGCDTGQGYLFAPPCTAEEFGELL